MITTFTSNFETTLNLAQKIAVAHGETFELLAYLFDNGISVDLTGYDLQLLYQDVCNLSAYYTIDGTVDETGAAKIVWTAANDVGAKAYRFHLKATKDEEVSYPARWEVGMYPTPDFEASHLDPQVPYIDFDQYELIHAPWVLLSDFNILSNGLSAKADLSALDAYLPLSGGSVAHLILSGDAFDGAFLSFGNPRENATFLTNNSLYYIENGAIVSRVSYPARGEGNNQFATLRDIYTETSGKADLSALDRLVPKTTTINDQQLTGDIDISATQITVGGNSIYALASVEGVLVDLVDLMNDLEEDIPTKTSDLDNDSGFITNQSLSGYVPTSRTINGQQLTGNIVLDASDVSAATEAFVLESIGGKLDISGGPNAGSIVWETPYQLKTSQADLKLYNGYLWLNNTSIVPRPTADPSRQLTLPAANGQIALTSDITTATSALASITYVDTSISSAIGNINSVLDAINGETI